MNLLSTSALPLAGRAAVLAAAVLLAAGSASAQAGSTFGPRVGLGPQVSGGIHVSATVVQSLEVLGINNLSFGQVVAANAAISTRIDKNDPDAGRFQVTGSGNETIQVSYVAPSQLTREAGAGVIGVQLELYGSSRPSNASSAERLLTNETVSLVNGQYFFFVGGELQVGPLTQNPPGRYLGDFELEVSYVNL